MHFHIDIIICYVSTLIDCNVFFSLLSLFFVSYSTISYVIAFLSSKIFVNIFFQKITHVIDYSSCVIDYIIPRTLQHMQ